MERVTANIKMQHPFGCFVAGPSMSGKSSLIANILSDPSLILSAVPQRIVYVYSAWQDSFDTMKNVTFIKNLDKVLEEDYFDSSERNLLILDDVMTELADNPNGSKLFTKYIHHKSISVFFLVQNLFVQGKSMRNIVLNCHYMILFRNNRGVSQIQLLGRQLGLRHLVAAYKTCTREPYGYLFVDLHPKTPDVLKLQSDLFDNRRVFLQK